MTRVLRVAWFWMRVGFTRRWVSYVTIALLVALIGGVAMGAVAAARRTQSSFNVFLKSTNPSDMDVTLYAPNITKDLSHLPLVRRVGTLDLDVNAFPAGRDGAPALSPALKSGDVLPAGSMNGEYFSMDRPAVVDGRLANARKSDEFVMTVQAARLMGWHVGEVIPMYFYTPKQTDSSAFGTAKVKPHLELAMHLVGTVVLNSEVVLDEVDRYPTFMVFTPALTQRLVGSGGQYFTYALQLDHGGVSVSTVEREIVNALPSGLTYTYHVTSLVTAQVDRSIEPESIALGVFGLIAALATLIIAGGLISRALVGDDPNLAILRALGADKSMIVSSSLLGVGMAAFVGAVLAVAVAVALSPLAPIGPVRSAYPFRGLSFDGLVLGLGFVLLVVVLVGLGLLLALRRARRLTARQHAPVATIGSRAARLLANAGFPVTSVIGVRFAIEPGRERNAVPVRSALFGSALAVIIVVATLTFGSGLSTLVSHPALYGWNWKYALTGSAGVPPQAAKLLARDPDVAADSGVTFANAQINGLTVPIILAGNHAKVSAPLIAGHEVDAVNQIVLGAATLQQLHKHLGGYVTASYGSKKDYPVYVPPTRMHIVGVATLPAVGTALTLHTSMGVGAIIPVDIEPPAFQKVIESGGLALSGFDMIFIRLRHGVSDSVALASLNKIARVGDRVFEALPDGEGEGDDVTVLSVQYPAEIENYRSIGATPAVLALSLAAGAVVALGLTLEASVRRRRRDLALLRALGFSRGQLRSVVAWQASVAGLVGVVIGVPLGIVLGQWLWTLFARYINAVPEPTVPVLSIFIVAACAFALANIVAALPGRSAARTPTAQVLRGE
jgi:hypothetical protein